MQVRFLLFFLGAFLRSSFATGQEIPGNWESISLNNIPVRVIDGDTFDADLNGNGRFSKSRERIRLLYVDTPELSSSHKGRDVVFGKPAGEFLRRGLSEQPATLWINPEKPRGNNGRLLAVVENARGNLNLMLISRGHSYFDTRFAWPADFITFARSEAEAFENRRGIWSTRASRHKYLKRLKKEGKTVYSRLNPLFVGAQWEAMTLDLSRFHGRFVRVAGTIKRTRDLRKGAKIIYLRSKQGKNGIPVITFRQQRNLQGLRNLRKGDRVQVEGFVQVYKGKREIRLYRAIKLH